MRGDPSLVLATLAYQFAAKGGTPAQLSKPLSLSELANFWRREGRNLWEATNWLACPSFHQSGVFFARFSQLDCYFQTLPLRRWPRQASAWMRAAGGNASDWDFADVELDAQEQGQEQEHEQGPSFQAHELITRLIDHWKSSDRRSGQLAVSMDRIKMDLAHSLAYGLSHEINNPLANISTRAQSLARVVGESSHRQSLLRIVDQTSRAHAMIADLMFYANPPRANCQPFDLQACLTRTLDGFAEDARRCSISIGLFLDPDVEVHCVEGDAEMIGEAVAVLVRNSIEAIGVDGAVQVHVTPNRSEGAACRIRVCDSGPGLTQDQAAKAFDPYYSGREAGRGLGLGLCRAQRIMQLHGGSIALEPALAGCVATIQW